MDAVIRRGSARWLPLLLAAVLAAASPLAAQARMDQTPSRFSGSLTFLNTQPLGALEVGPGFGMGLSVSGALDPARILRIRGEMRVAFYGRDTRTVCLSQTVGCLIEVDVNTDYTSYYFGAGPELAFPILGSTLVLDATAGVGGFAVTSSVQGISDPDNQDLFTTKNFDDSFFAWTVGGELRVPIAPIVSIAMGVRYQHNGETSYVREGGVTLNGDGSVAVDAITTDANQMALTLGIAFHPFQGWTEKLGDDDG